MSKLSAIGGAVVSVVSTTAGLIGDTWALLYTDKDFARLYTMMKGQAVEYADLHKKISPVMEQQQTRREIVLDSLGLGTRGFLGQLIGWQVPEELQRAYSLACPDLAAQMSLQHAIQAMNDMQLNGFSNLLKGKLFELRYAEYLNDGPALCGILKRRSSAGRISCGTGSVGQPGRLGYCNHKRTGSD